MNRIVVNDVEGRELTFFLAMEEYVASRKDLEESMFFWKVGPTVIFGRNQVMSAEVDVKWCEENGVRMVRRKSGGGCVYSDKGNLMISYVSSGTEAEEVFGGYLRRLCSALQSLGLPAEVSGRNDVLIDGRKVSGNAFQLLGDRSIVHGTLMYDVDFEALERALTPPAGKLGRKGVASVRQHVVNLRDYLPVGSTIVDVDSLAEELAGALCDSEVVLDSDAVSAICEFEKSYLDPAFIAGHEAGGKVVRLVDIEGVGQFKVELRLENERIEGVHLSGDYFAKTSPEELDSALTATLKGQTLQDDAIRNAVTGLVEKFIIFFEHSR
ncbi:MAG: lipoyltransferase [Bacteroidales bacterium]|nr:lipoyltransferase [Bacteroidales bacterium]